jgi:hypothetical protein
MPDGILFKRDETDPFFPEGALAIGLRNLDQAGRIAGPIVLDGFMSRLTLENEPFHIILAGTYDFFSEAGGFVLSGANLEYIFAPNYTAGGVRQSNTNWLRDGQLTSTPTITTTGLSFSATDKTNAGFNPAFPRDAAVLGWDWTFEYQNNR